MKINSFTPAENIKRSHRKENKLFKAYTGIAVHADGTHKEAVDMRVYYPGERAYVCVWVRGEDKSGSGSDYAGGYGYDKISAAADGALKAAGVDMERFGGTGQTSEAVKAVTDFLFPDALTTFVVHSHG